MILLKTNESCCFDVFANAHAQMYFKIELYVYAKADNLNM